jgi:hypothetical protein
MAIGGFMSRPRNEPVLPSSQRLAAPRGEPSRPAFQQRRPLDVSGYGVLPKYVMPWGPDASLEEVRRCWDGWAARPIQRIRQQLEDPSLSKVARKDLLLELTQLLNAQGEADQAYKVVTEARALVESDPALARALLATMIYAQGITAMRRGENDNCIMCRGESSCILPISPAAVHTNPEGSRLAIKHFTEYLRMFPDDLEVRWLMNLAHMTLGEHPAKVDPRFLISLDHFRADEFQIGRFPNIAHRVGVDRFNQAGGAIMDDFDNDGLLDLVVTSWDQTVSMCIYRNKGDGTFEDVTERAGVTHQLGGLYCVQTDYNNDGRLDIFIARGAWMLYPVRPTLLRNDGDLKFTDVTAEAGLIQAVNSNSASWCDYDNDGWLDMFLCCERQPNLLYHNEGDGTFKEVSRESGLWSVQQQVVAPSFTKGSAWLDFDNDGNADLYLSNLDGMAQFFRNNGDGTFTEATRSLGIDGPNHGFSCWAWDYDNDGWLDIFGTCYDRTLADVVKDLQGQQHSCDPTRLYRNMGGKGFKDVTGPAGLDHVFVTMGSNLGDFDNDGFLDFYLGTGDPHFSTLVPNRMFKNVAGQRFAEITASSGTGHLQKGHGVACGDWDRDGDTDVFIELGGVVDGDRFHNVLFENPGQGNHWLTVKLVGKKTNRAAIGARIKVVTAGKKPLTVHRHVSSGSSFGANPLEQVIGLGKADRVDVLEVYWPTSRTTQRFRDIAVNQGVEITEFRETLTQRSWTPIVPVK